jgi:hypothetical protein
LIAASLPVVLTPFAFAADACETVAEAPISTKLNVSVSAFVYRPTRSIAVLSQTTNYPSTVFVSGSAKYFRGPCETSDTSHSDRAKKVNR